MFSKTAKHPSDRVLICALDGELPSRRRAAVDAHVRGCHQCRARVEALAAIGAETAEAARGESARWSRHEALRDRLRAEMVRRAPIRRSRWFRLRRAVAALELGPRLTPAAAALVLIVPTIWLTYSVISRNGSPRDVEAAALPDHALTPGAVGPVSLTTLCAGRSVDKPAIAPAVRETVLRGYRMERVDSREYELDYLVTPELGGVPDPRNLWPERYSAGVWNARVKDDLEDLLPKLICRGDLDLPTAQREIADNWIAAYRKHFRTDHPIRAHADRRDDDGGAPRAVGRVSLNVFAPFTIDPSSSPSRALTYRGH